MQRDKLPTKKFHEKRVAPCCGLKLNEPGCNFYLKDSKAPLVKKCQIFSVPQVAAPVGFLQRVIQFFSNRLRRILKRRFNYLRKLFCTEGGANQYSPAAVDGKTLALQVGEIVRVRSKEEIEATLNRWNQLRGCAFLEEMSAYCGTTQKVYKRVERFLDERDYVVKRTKGLYLLEGITCNGTKDFGRCDRSCFFFWREEWLEKCNL